MSNADIYITVILQEFWRKSFSVLLCELNLVYVKKDIVIIVLHPSLKPRGVL